MYTTKSSRVFFNLVNINCEIYGLKCYVKQTDTFECYNSIPHHNNIITKNGKYKRWGICACFDSMYEVFLEVSYLEKVCYYVDGKKHGLVEHWFENDKREKLCNYVNGLKHGLYETWHYNGYQIYRRRNYLNGLKHGIFESWDIDGKLLKYCTYVDGLKHGIFESWDIDGKRLKYCNYIDGLEYWVSDYMYATSNLEQYNYGFKLPTYL